MAIACFRLFTFRPLPLLSFPRLNLCISRSTDSPARLPYRGMTSSFAAGLRPWSPGRSVAGAGSLVVARTAAVAFLFAQLIDVALVLDGRGLAARLGAATGTQRVLEPLILGSQAGLELVVAVLD